MRKDDVYTAGKANNSVKGCQGLFAGFCSLEVNEPRFASETKCGSLTIWEEQIPEGHLCTTAVSLFQLAKHETTVK